MENEKNKPIPPEVVKLSERVAKDPSSKLFVPLAEEYIKLDMLAEAETALLDGLKNHETYLSARVLLGKVFLKRGERAKALAEFEEVVRANPDNLLAHKKLAEIYMVEGRVEDARRSCQAVLAFNPADLDMLTLRENLAKQAAPEPQRDVRGTAPVSPSPSAAIDSSSDVTGARAGTETVRSDEKEARGATEDAGARIDTAQMLETHMHEAQKPASPETVVESPPAESPTSDSPAEVPPPTNAEEDVPVVVLPDEETDVATFLAELSSGEETPSPQRPPITPESASAPEPVPRHETAPTFTIEDETWESAGPSMKSAPADQGVASEGPSAVGRDTPAAAPDSLATEALAELYIRQGFYEKGIAIYRRILEQEPRRAGIRQKLDDVITLTNLLGDQAAAPSTSAPDEKMPKASGIVPGERESADAELRELKTDSETSPETFRASRIRKLEAWLERIQARSQER